MVAMEYGGQDAVYQTLNKHSVLVGRNYILLDGFLWNSLGYPCRSRLLLSMLSVLCFTSPLFAV